MQLDFSLQSVLDYRSTVVDSLEMELAQLLRQKKQVEKNLALCEQIEKQLWHQMINEQQGEMDLVWIDQLQCQLENLEKEKEILLAQLKELVGRVYAKRQEIVAAKQDEEVLEIIKEKQLHEFEQRVKLEDQKLQDDIYIARAFQSRAA